MTDRQQKAVSEYGVPTDGPVPPAVLIMSAVFMAGLIALGYVQTVHADSPFARQYLSGGRFWIAVSFHGFLCALIANELHRKLVDRKKRRLADLGAGSGTSASRGGSDA